MIIASTALKNIKSTITTPLPVVDDLIVEYNTPFDDVDMLLPQYLVFNLSNGSTEILQVEWQIGSYVAGTEGAYNLTANIILPDTITNPLSLLPTVEVTVQQRYSMWFSTEYLTSLFQETSTNEVTNPVTADGQSVGHIYDRGNDSLYANTLTNTSRPILGSSGSMNGYLTGQGVHLIIPSSTGRFKYFYDTNTWFFQICFKKETGSDGVLKVLMRSLGASPNTGDIGVSCRLTTANQFQFFSYKGTAGNVVCSVTSAQTITVASGWTRAQVIINGSGANTATLYLTTESGVDVTELFSTNAGVVTAGNAVNDLRFGGETNVSIAAIFSDQRIPSAGEITAFKTYNPTRKTENFPLVKKWDLFDDPSFLFADTAAATPSSDGGIVRLARSKKPLFLGFTRDATATTDAKSPLYRAADAAINNHSALEWDGSDDNFVLSSNFFIERARYIYVVIVKNEDASNGSHIVSGQRYIALTGSSYTAGTNPRIQGHAIDQSGVFSIPSGNLTETYNIFIFQKVGAAWTVWNGNKLKNTGTNNQEFRITDIGDPFASIGELWRMDGRQHRAIQFNGTLTDAQAENIIDYFNIKLGI